MATPAFANASVAGDRIAEFIRAKSPRVSDRTARRVARGYLALEFLVLYTLPPLVILFDWIPGLHPFVILWTAATLCVVWLWWCAPDFDRAELTRIRLLFNWRVMAPIMLPFVGLATAIGLLVYWFAPHLLFNFPRQEPVIWILVMVGYPILSVIPQTIVFRTFLLYRYRTLFRSRWALWVAASMAFAFVHIIFRNPIAVALTAIGGTLFVEGYLRTRSVWVSVLQHSLYGCWVMTIGLGVYIYYEAAKELEAAGGVTTAVEVAEGATAAGEGASAAGPAGADPAVSAELITPAPLLQDVFGSSEGEGLSERPAAAAGGAEGP